MPSETRSAGSTGVGDAGSSVRAVQKGMFRKEGEYWTVGCGGKSFRLKDSKGLGYLAHLLRHPGVEFHVLDLAGGIAGQRDHDEPGQSAHGLPGGDEDLEKAGIHIGGLSEERRRRSICGEVARDIRETARESFLFRDRTRRQLSSERRWLETIELYLILPSRTSSSRR